jgi:two-component system phosphate regulon sensor histidine kinase PhoR
MTEVQVSALAFIEAIPDPALLLDQDGEDVAANARWREAQSSLNGEVSLLRSHVRACVSREAFTIPLDESGARQLVVSAVADKTTHYLAVLRDESEIRRVEQMRKDFIANVSHELRTPLTAVRGYVETLMDPQFLTPDRVREFLPIIFEHTERLHNLMLDLLSLSRLESPGTKIDLTPVPLYDELRSAVDAVTPLAKLRKVQIELREPDDSILAQANAEHLERVLVNLLDNAVKYGRSEGRIEVWTELHDGHVWTHVRDEGLGIAPDEVPRIFERFYRSREALAGGRRGSGLGLAIVKHIIQQLGGEVGVASEVGKGSDFYFSLQLDSSQA